LTVAFDGTGRFRYERTTSAGLREQVVCDGTSLWHLYPELGIGARRAVSRFHRQDFARLVPWALPPVEDLARGADLVSIDERTVAIVPHNLPSPSGRGATDASPEGASVHPAKGAALEKTPSLARSDGPTAQKFSSPENGWPVGPTHTSVWYRVLQGCALRWMNGWAFGPNDVSLRTHLVFAADGRLAERQLVEMPSGKIRIRETYRADGTVEFVAGEKKDAGGTPTPQKNAGGTPTLRRQIQLAPCGAPELKPDAALVVLPLPLRSRQQVLGVRKLPADETYSNWSEEDALAMIAADLGDNPAEMKQVIAQRFFRRGDRRLGFHALLLSTGQTWNPKEKQDVGGGDPLLLDPLADHPNDPLAKYVAACLASSRPGGPKDFGDPAQTTFHDSTFLRQLAEFHDLWNRWHDGRATQGDASQQQQERQRALAFVERAQSPELAWGLLMEVRGAFTGDEHQRSAAAIRRFEAVPGLEYAARYERARASLFVFGDGIRARDLFCRLFKETLEAGLVPPIDGSFRDALLRGGDGGQWPATIRAAAKKLIDAGARPSAVYLARQVQQVGDPPLAEEVFDMALRDCPEGQRLGLTLARIEHCRQTGQLPRADALLQSLLGDQRYGGLPALWYLADAIADARGMTARAIGFRQRALDIEFVYLPEKVNVEVVRGDYGQLLARYEKLATAIGPSHEAAPRDMLAAVVRTADRWRQFDTDPTAACQAAARILGQLGETDLAWDYLTTPLSVQPNEAASWGKVARTLRQQGQVDLADRAYAAAFDAEPANAQILWDRAESLQENGRRDQARPLFQKIAAGPWGSQFADLQNRAKKHVGK
jgi:tetratricopeptide (TPR) repeat protein